MSKPMLAQHCPFDGSHLISIKVVNKQGRMVSGLEPRFYLQEVDNPMADSCTQAKGLRRKQFLSSDAFIAETSTRFNGYNKALINRLNDAGVFTKANLMLMLNQAENTCTLIGKTETAYTNYIYRQRKFDIVYYLNGKEMRQALPAALIYALCTNNKDLKSFKTITIKI